MQVAKQLGTVRDTADREMYLGTLFLRNRPLLDLIRRLVDDGGLREQGCGPDQLRRDAPRAQRGVDRHEVAPGRRHQVDPAPTGRLPRLRGQDVVNLRKVDAGGRGWEPFGDLN